MQLGLTIGLNNTRKQSRILREIVAWGDSTTATSNADWVAGLATATGWTVINKGVAGNTMAQILTRMSDDFAADPLMKLRSHLLMGGRNDLGAWNDAAYDYTKPQIMLDQFAAAAALIGHNRFRFSPCLPHGSGSGERAGGYRRTQLDWLYDQGDIIYGSKWINDLPAFLAAAVESDSQDVTYQVPPLSLRTDDIHFTTTATQKVGASTNGSAIMLDNRLKSIWGDWIANQAPIVDAGEPQTIVLPVDDVSLTGTASDPDSLPYPLTHLWELETGPTSVTIGSPTALSTTVTFTIPGTYVLRLTSTDGRNSTSDIVTVVVSPDPEAPPAEPGNRILIRTGDVILTRAGDTVVIGDYVEPEEPTGNRILTRGGDAILTRAGDNLVVGDHEEPPPPVETNYFRLRAGNRIATRAGDILTQR